MNALADERDGARRDHVEADPVGVRTEALRRQRLEPTDLADRARLQWAIGIAERELGHLDAAAAELRSGVDLADAAGDVQLGAGLKMTLAVVIGRLGDLDGALELLDAAEPALRGAEQARVVVNRGLVLYWRGEFGEAAAALESACRALKRHGDRTGELRTRVTLGAVLGQVRDFRSADRHLREAIRVAEDVGQSLIVASAHHNLGYLGMLQRDLPTAIAEFEEAEAGYVASGANGYLPQVHANHAHTLADAGLLDDAELLGRRALEMLAADGNEIEIAGALVGIAEIRLAQRRGGGSSGRRGCCGVVSQAGKGRLGSDLYESRAAGRRSRGPAANGSRRRSPRRRQPTRRGRSRRRSDAIAVGRRPRPCRVERGRLRRSRRPGNTPTCRRGPAVDQILLAHVDALVAQHRGDLSAARRAIRRGLEVAMTNQASLGSIETRAHAAVHGNALTEIGARMAIVASRPRELLRADRGNQDHGSPCSVDPSPADPGVARLLAELRSMELKLADHAVDADDRRNAEVAHSRLERDIRRRSRMARGDASARTRLQRELNATLSFLGDRQLLAHARVDGRLHAVSVIAGRAQLHDLGPVDDVNERIEALTFSLHRLNRIQGSDESRLAAAEMLYAFADELAEIVLPPVVAESFDPVVIVPTAILHDVPWGLLPPLAGRPVSVNPSVSAWGHAERTLRERRGTLHDGIDAGFVAGPGLDFADIEVKHLAGGYVDPVVLVGEEATVAACTGLLSRAELVHVACHGSFRQDNPMFSSLHVADGPLNIYDLESLPRLPVVVVLSSCSVANAKVVQGGSLLGLANAFTTLGAASVIAPLTPISDAAAVTVMDRLHREIVAGADPAAALAAATMTHDVADPTAAAFIALGA